MSTVAVDGTATESIEETALLSPGLVVRWTLTGDTWAPAGGGGEVGDSTQEATNQAFSLDYIYAFRAQADYTGALNTAYFYHNSTTADQAPMKVLVYTSNNAALPSDTALALVGASASITPPAATGWQSAAISGNVTSGDYYWIVLVNTGPGYGSVDLARTNTANLYYKTSGGFAMFTSPPDPLSAASWEAPAALAPISAYVTSGP